MIHADRTLARRLESLICSEFHGLAEAGRRALAAGDALCVDVAGGVALWLGQGSPVNRGAWQGMAGPVDDTEMERLEAFYHRRGADAMISACPLADPSLVESLGRRGWHVTEFEHVLALELEEWAPRDVRGVRLEVRVCAPAERETWAQIAGLAFAGDDLSGQGYGEFGAIMLARKEAILVLGWVDGQAAGTGALVIDGGVGWLSGDATLPQHRRRGVQSAIQELRLQLARDAGCDLAVTEVAPGSGSQRNMERRGFRVVYTRVEFAKPLGVSWPQAGARFS